MEEKRAFSRIEIDTKTVALINNKRINCIIRDLSEKGALLEVTYDPHAISPEEVTGEKINFLYSADGGFEIKYIGNVLRCETVDNKLYLGIKFDDQFFFQED